MKRLLVDIYKFLFVRKYLYRFHQRLLNISLWGLGILNSENTKWSGEEFLLKELSKLLDQEEPLTVLDIGANKGDYAKLVKRLHPTATVYSFEPNPESFRILVDQSRTIGYHAFELGLSDSIGKIALYDRESGPGSVHASLYPQTITELHHDQPRAVEINVTTVDQFVHNHQIPRIHLLKIDTEGHDLSVLKGARDTIQRGMVCLIQFEFNEMNVISGVRFRDFAAYLDDYTLFRMLPDGLVKVELQPTFLSEIYAFQNIAAVRNDLL